MGPRRRSNPQNCPHFVRVWFRGGVGHGRTTERRRLPNQKFGGSSTKRVMPLRGGVDYTLDYTPRESHLGKLLFRLLLRILCVYYGGASKHTHHKESEMPQPQDFCERAQFRAADGNLQARLDGVVYPVVVFGDTAIQVLDPTSGDPVATLGFKDGKFVPAGEL